MCGYLTTTGKNIQILQATDSFLVICEKHVHCINVLHVNIQYDNCHVSSTFIILCNYMLSLKCTSIWPSMPYAGPCVFTWWQFKCPH